MAGQRVLCIDMDIGLRNLDISLGLSDRALMDFADVALGPLHPVPGRRAPPGPEGAVFTYCSHVPPPQPEPLSGALYAVRRPDAV